MKDTTETLGISGAGLIDVEIRLDRSGAAPEGQGGGKGKPAAPFGGGNHGEGEYRSPPMDRPLEAVETVPHHGDILLVLSVARFCGQIRWPFCGALPCLRLPHSSFPGDQIAYPGYCQYPPQFGKA